MNLNSMKEELGKDWFVHPEGFLASFGGPKAPKDPKKAGVSLDHLQSRTQKMVQEAMK